MFFHFDFVEEMNLPVPGAPLPPVVHVELEGQAEPEQVDHAQEPGQEEQRDGLGLGPAHEADHAHEQEVRREPGHRG